MSVRCGFLAALGLLITGPACAPAGARVDGRVAGTPIVQGMVVGRGGAILYGPQALSASATRVRVGGRSCAIASGTPLAELAAARRAGGPGFSLRDYGDCGGAAANSSELYVASVAGESGSGQNGWEYKVNGVSGTAGAADPSGPEGNGRRLGSGAHVLWFWCQASYGGCQRTLELFPSRTTVSPGANLQVRVYGYDNYGRAQAVTGAIVALGTDFASTGAGGTASVIAPTAPGRYEVMASRAGLVPAFPQTIVVR